MKSKAWLQAFRLRTLPLALSCIGMGGFLAASVGAFRWDIFLLCVTTTIFLQILSNLANDYGDSIHGADSEARKGPSRAVQSGAISLQQMRTAILVFSLLSLGSGLTLLWIAFGTDWNAIVFFLVLGILSIFAAIGYTVGKKPYGYIGLGDLSVLVFFGLIGVLGSYYLFAKRIGLAEVLPALSCGFFSMAVLNVNNIRDIDSDKLAGKFSIPVRIGRTLAVRYHALLLIAAVLCSVVYTFVSFQSLWQFLFLLVVPLVVQNGMAVYRKPSSALDPFLKQLALTTLLFVVLFGIGLLISSM